MNKQSPSIQVLDTAPTVTLIVQSVDGKPQGFLSGEARSLATWLDTAAADPASPVKVEAINFVTVGQTVYEVDREFFLAVRGGMGFLTWQTIRDLENSIPTEARLFFVVSY